jgi:AraC-like DNA-binding protein
MDSDTNHIIVASSLEGIGKGELAGYIPHVYCHEGWCTFKYHGDNFRLEAGDSMIIPRRNDLVTDIVESDDLRMDVIYVSHEFIMASTPQSNYGTKGHLSLFGNPVMRLTPEQQKVCALDFDFIKRRMAFKEHLFHREAMRNAVECMIIDFFDFHASQHGADKISTQYQQLMENFIQLLEHGDFRKNRDIGYYADRLCVTTKYLSEVSKNVSGQSANYWITRYATLDIARLLSDRRLSFTDISDMYGFSSLSYFIRYVQKNLGAPPSAFRE